MPEYEVEFVPIGVRGPIYQVVSSKKEASQLIRRLIRAEESRRKEKPRTDNPTTEMGKWFKLLSASPPAKGYRYTVRQIIRIEVMTREVMFEEASK
jgi:hypothetical protein